jgi:hypothetical protein
MSSANRAQPVPRVVNQIWGFFIRRGLAPKTMHLLTVKGRKTGKLHTLVVGLVTQNAEQFLVAPYGEVNWVLNARAAGQVLLRHGSQEWTAHIEELSPAQAGLVLKQYLAEHLVTRSYFDVGPTAPASAFEQEANRHPVFHLQPI